MNQENKKYYKKGQAANNAIGNVILLIVGLAVATLTLIFTTSLGGQTYNLIEADLDAITPDVTNESFSAFNSSATSLGNDNIVEGSLKVFNSTTDIGLGNFTVDYGAGTVQLNAGALPNASSFSANYTHGNLTIEQNIKNAIVSSFSAQEQTADYLPIIVLAVVIFLVMGLVLGFANFGGGKGSLRGSAL